MPDDDTHDEAIDVSDLVAAVPLARAALAETTPEATIGEPLGHVVEGDGAVSLRFAALLAGYPGWHWTVTVGRADDDAQPTVLEVELMPGDGALLAPDWVPWSERLAEYQAAQEALAAETEEAGAEGDGDGDDEDVDGDYDDEYEDDESAGSDDEDSDDSDDDHDIHDLHGDDDLDGVDIDSVDVAYDDETDVDAELDLASEEAAALADDEDAEDEQSADEQSADEQSADEQSADDSAMAAGARDAEVGEAEQA